MRMETSASPSFTSFFVVAFSLFFSSSFSEARNFLPRGSSLSVEHHSDILVSPNRTFTCGFYWIGDNAYSFSVWFTNSKERTVVWMANRDRPVNGRGSRISLRRNGAMVLTDVDGSTIWETNTTSTDVSGAEVLDSGNLVLKDPRGKIIWQSFDFPTDTLLPNQFFTKSTKLISSIYWPNPDFKVFASGRTNYNGSRIAVFDEMGNFLSSDQLQFSASDMGFGILRRLTMDFDGNLRLYSLNNETGLWETTWEAMLEQCKVHGICGRNAICVYTPEPKCSCPPGYEVTEHGNWNKGCKPKFTIENCSQEWRFVQVPQVDFYGFDLNYSQSISRDSCLKLCLEDCRCAAFSYRVSGEGLCFTKSALFNGYKSPNFPGSIYMKLPASVGRFESAILNGTNPICKSNDSTLMMGSSSMYDTIGKKVKWAYLYWFASSIGVIEILFIVSVWWLALGIHDVPESLAEGYRAITSQFRKFSYSELKRATKNFKEELGRGGSGAVYKGILADERAVAVKRLAGLSYQGEDVFWAEVSTIGKINHMNLVRMWGFCSEANHRLLVYEYLENQSLDKHLFSPSSIPWKQRFKVALGTAKGLAYLHHECLEWVIHCDVKPENILLDTEFEAKISDFGLAKLSQRGDNNSEFSRIRGTKGYMAPEWALNFPITAKVDVYSYGVVILEMVRGIRLSNFIMEDGEAQESELTRFVRLVKRKIECGEESWIEEAVDRRLNGEYCRRQVVKMVEVGIRCAEEDRDKRPTMDSVVQALLECEDESKIRSPDDQ
ncbi:putative receptor protein kinase ZmPK1 isoform X2 [Manihot esculenta]|uniref:Receptor-like serine/threonine-protein kinase n=1 Tax=Manihot esculenta TaxID=3983 RepID=A0A2C9VAL0_MANES|nr:putative receptor protein kinase ZmPK1 isoform X2 [Manihot esculenta]OAY41375.1 hypothetical protein MANES_09G096900v8 [Manihot esculenta]